MFGTEKRKEKECHEERRIFLKLQHVYVLLDAFRHL